MSVAPLVRSICFSASALLASVAAADVRVVGAGQPYATIQAAVNASVDGDTVLVRPGTYASFTIDGKSIHVVGDPVARPTVNGMTIRNLPAGGEVVIARFVNTGWRLHGLLNAGRVRFADCALDGGPTNPYYGGIEAAWIDDCANVAFERCVLRGGNGNTFEPSAEDGHAALRVLRSQVALYDCTLTGGKGGSDYTHARVGGAGLLVAGTPASFVHASGTSFTGGNGGDTFEDLTQYVATVGDGGPGVDLRAGQALWQIECTATGGLRGQWHFCLPAYYGVDGPPMIVQGSLFTFNQPRLSMQVPSVVRAGTSATLTFTGEPGAEVFLLTAPRSVWLPTPSMRGVQLVKPRAPFLQPIAAPVVLDATGHGTLVLPIPALPPGVQSATMWIQSYRTHPSNSVTLGSFVPLTILDPSL